ncbi:MAG: zinc ribbon domain-containing protein [Calditrichaeota bacterium]|nr:MAG: zinc ribbon domain-containing protein [Calditrichota bacterium]
MPIYEYKCDACNSQFDLLRPMNSSDDDVKCESCGSGEVHKLLSTFASTGPDTFSNGGGGCAPYGGFS